MSGLQVVVTPDIIVGLLLRIQVCVRSINIQALVRVCATLYVVTDGRVLSNLLIVECTSYHG